MRATRSECRFGAGAHGQEGLLDVPRDRAGVDRWPGRLPVDEVVEADVEEVSLTSRLIT